MANTKKNDVSELTGEELLPVTDKISAAAEAERILAEARSEAEKIVEDAKSKATETLETAKEAVQAQAEGAAQVHVDPGDEMVTVHLFKDNERYKSDVFAAVNGESVQIRRGETVTVKRKFADVLSQSMDQDAATANMIERESADFAAKARELNI